MDNLMTVAAVMLAAAGLIVLALIWIVRERRTINPLSPQQIGDLIRRLDEAVRRAELSLAELQRATADSLSAPRQAPPAGVVPANSAETPGNLFPSPHPESQDDMAATTDSVQRPGSLFFSPRPEPQQDESAIAADNAQRPGSLYPPPRLESQQDEILRLHGQGMDWVDIARRLDLTVGEVELTVNLSKSLGRYVAVKPSPQPSPAQTPDAETPD